MRNVVYAIIILIVTIIVATLYAGLPRLNNEGASLVPPPITDGNDRIYINNPVYLSSISSPMNVSGTARGNWYFEGVFPVVVVDWDGRIVGEGHADAMPEPGKDWMTDDFVPFTGTITFTKPTDIVVGTFNQKGTVIFKKDNPSGLPQNDAVAEVPVIFK